MELTDKELITIQRMIGKIEGAAFAFGVTANPILDAVEVLDEIFDKEDNCCGIR